MWKHVGKKKAVRVAPGAGSRLQDDSMAVHILNPVLRHSADNPQAVVGSVDPDRVVAGHVNDYNHVLTNLAGESDSLLTSALLWERSDFEWSLRGAAVLCPRHDEITDVLSAMLEVSAIQGNQRTAGLRPTAQQLVVLKILRLNGVCRRDLWL